MKAAWYERNGDAADVLVVGEMPDPHAGPGEVRVRIATSAVNPSDVKSRAGTSRQIQFPRQVPHSDGAGVIDEVGPGVAGSRLGERVWLWNAAFERAGGTAAQWTVVPAAQAVALLPGLDDAAGACLGIPAITAHRAVFAGGPPTGLTVLVAGGAGVVGHYAVQLAKWAGARVVATVSSPEKAEHARAAGADAAIDYRQQDAAERILAATDGAGVDRIVEVDFAQNLALDLQVAKMGASIAVYAALARTPQIPFFELLKRNLVLRFVHMYGLPMPEKQAAIRDITAWAMGGHALFSIAERFALDRIVDAHRAVESGSKIGQVIVDLP
jgi:NADPH2:quinone reductase